MNLNSTVLIAIAFALYFIYRTGHRLILASGTRGLFILLANLVVYGWFVPSLIPAILSFASTGFVMGRICGGLEDQKANKIAFAYVILCLIFFVTYRAGWSLPSDNTEAHGFVRFLLPLGFSYALLQNISYVLDSRGRRRNDAFIDYLAVSTLFANVTAGPVLRPGDLIEKLKVADSPGHNVAPAMLLIVMGFFKKCLANMLAIYSPILFESNASWVGRALACICLVGQYYADFSGYTDLARGIARFFGIDLPINFDLPYLSRNMAEYRRRWHISMSNWFRDYVYFAIHMSLLRRWRGKLARDMASMISLVAVFVLIGLWHGLKWQFLVWGLGNGLLVFFAEAPPFFYRALPAIWRTLIGRTGTLAAIAAGETLIMWDFLQPQASIIGSVSRAPIVALDLAVWLPISLIGLVVPHALDFYMRMEEFQKPGWRYYLIFALLTFAALLIGSTGTSFVYANF